MAGSSSKSRRSTRTNLSSAKPRSYSELIKQGKVNELTESPQAEPERAADVRKADAVDWRGEYGQVFADLRQLLVISVVLFALMIFLGIVI